MKKTVGKNKGIHEEPPKLAPLPTWRSGGFRVNIADREALYRMMEEGPAATPAKPRL